LKPYPHRSLKTNTGERAIPSVRASLELNIPVLFVNGEVVISQYAKPTIELMTARAFQSVFRGGAATDSGQMD
jgi:hypothetical protein